MIDLKPKMKVYPNPWGIHPKELEPRVLPTGKVAPLMPPYASLDTYGRPIGACFVDVNGHRRAHAYVGARLDRERTVQYGEADQLRAREQITVWSFLGCSPDEPDFASRLAERQPVEIPLTDYYRDCLRKGSLIPGDASSTKVAGYRIKNLKQTFEDLHELAGIWFDENASEGHPKFHELEAARFEAEAVRKGGNQSGSKARPPEPKPKSQSSKPKPADKAVEGAAE